MVPSIDNQTHHAYQLCCVLDSLRSSEKRKSQARTEALLLKRDLVVEKCQRSEYVTLPFIHPNTS